MGYTLATGSYSLVLTEDVKPLDAGTTVRMLDLCYEAGEWWYAVMAKSETVQIEVREN